MKRTMLIVALGSMLAMGGLALGSDTASRSASGSCPGPCGPCPPSCAAQNAGLTMGGGCPSSCPHPTRN